MNFLTQEKHWCQNFHLTVRVPQEHLHGLEGFQVICNRTSRMVLDSADEGLIDCHLARQVAVEQRIQNLSVVNDSRMSKQSFEV